MYSCGQKNPTDIHTTKYNMFHTFLKGLMDLFENVS